MSYYDSLTNAGQFKKIYHSGEKLVFPEFVVYWRQNSADDVEESLAKQPNFINGSQIAFVASRKVGNAVKRNRSKRRLRAAFYPFFKDLQIDNMQIIFVARQYILNCEFSKINIQMNIFMKKINILK